jgi:hypothetical protein
MIRPWTIKITVLGLLLPVLALPHHNPVIYNGKKEVKISGVVTAARFGYPHTRILVNAQNDDGEIEKWTVMAEDPKDAREMGFDEALKSLKAGDEVTFVGWPHRYKRREMRGHEIHFADGTMVTMRTGNYIWTKDLRRIWHLRSGREEFDESMAVISPELSSADRLIAFMDEDEVIARIAFEITQESAHLFGLAQSGVVEFRGVQELMECHIDRLDFTATINLDDVCADKRKRIEDGLEYLSRYNDQLSLYWEQDIESC